MPDYQYPPPEKWQDFEVLCRDLWSRIWDDDGTQCHGREGQAQHGVDVFGRPGRGGDWAGVQCKLKSQLNGGVLKPAEIEAEVKKARGFNPRLRELVIATTATRDAPAQKAAREITERHFQSGELSVSVVDWQDICERLRAHPDVLALYYPGFAGAGALRGRATRKDYLEEMWEKLSPLHLLGVGRGAGKAKSVPLAEIYTALDVTAEASFRGIKSSEAPGADEDPDRLQGAHLIELSKDVGEYRARLEARLRQEAEARPEHQQQQPYRRRWMTLEMAAAKPRLVLLGPAGSGKSTFARHLALSMAGEALGRPEANLKRLEPPVGELTRDPALTAWPHGALLPVFIELKELVRSPCFPAEGEDVGAKHLLEFLEGDAPPEESFLREAFRPKNGALLILDGLDETPAAAACQQRLRQIVASFCRRFPHCRVLITCRPYAYEPASPWRLDDQGFHEARLAAFDAPKRHRFIDGWYAHLHAQNQVTAQQAERQAEALRREIAASQHLEALAERPLLLTLMADLHAAGGGRLPGGRAGLYERSVELLLDRWNEVRDVLESKSLSEHLGLPVEQLREALAKLAFEVHDQRGAKGTGAAEIEAKELWQALDDQQRCQAQSQPVAERQIMDYLHQRSGILVGESEDVYRFPHRSFQEYMAACHLVVDGFPELISGKVRENPALWREVLLLVAGQVAKTPYAVWALLEDLVPEEPEQDVRVDDDRFLYALYAALAVDENGLGRKVEKRDQIKLERIRKWLERSLELGALSPVDRAAGGRVLAILGDRRPGVGLRNDGVPEIDWVHVPSGRYPMGADDELVAISGGKSKHRVQLTEFSISRYPVTNAQYAAFVADGGYTETWRECWGNAGWTWKSGRQGPDDQQVDLLLANHPRVMVSWFEANAFCAWLSHKLSMAVQLPTEAQWEAAARGRDGRLYPWGSQPPTEDRANFENQIGRTTPVGAYPAGVGPFGVLDQAGNVCEWCADAFDEDAYKDRDGEKDPVVMPQDSSSGDIVRVLRGGAWGNPPQSLRAVPRFGYWSWSRDRILGFRVCRSGPEP